MLARIHDEMRDSLNHLDEVSRAKVICAYVDYQLHGTEPSKDDLLVYTAFKTKQFDLDIVIKDIKASIENWKKWWRKPKNFENSQKPKTNLNQPKPNLSESEQEQEHEHKEKEIDKSISKKERPSVSELVWAYEENEILVSQIWDSQAIRERAEYKQSRKDRAYKTVWWFIQQLSVIVNTIRWWQPRWDVATRFRFAINQAKERERKWIFRTEQTENEYQWWKKTLAFNQNKNEWTFT